MEEKLFKFIQDTIEEVTGKKGLVMDTDFVKDLGLNSFDIMNVVCAFEEHFDIEIPNRDVWQLRQVKDVIAYMIKKGYTEV
jgi:acyl carrier protein